MTSVFVPLLATRSWPIGPHVLTGLDFPFGRPEAGWVAVKLHTAQWYLDTLGELKSSTADLDRFLGVEMALDGYLSAVSSMFDAAVAALIQVLGEGSANPINPHDYNWSNCKKAARKASVVLQFQTFVEDALKVDANTNPMGWLAELRRLRNRSTHMSTLSRHFNRGIGGPELAPLTELRLPTGAAVEVTAYCRDRLARAVVLCALMCADLDHYLSGLGR